MLWDEEIRATRVITTVKPMVTLKSSATTRNKSNIGSRGGAASPPSALRTGKFGKRQSLDLRIVDEVFGANMTLYQVLGVQPHAGDAEVRKAYLMHGKKALLLNGVISKGGCEVANVPDAARKKFQAVSRAYEILSTPELRIEYDLYGDVSSPSSISSSASGSGVEWRPYVEQMIFTEEKNNVLDARSDEHSRPSEITGSSKKSKSREVKSSERDSPVVEFSPCTFGGCLSTFF